MSMKFAIEGGSSWQAGRTQLETDRKKEAELWDVTSEAMSKN